MVWWKNIFENGREFLFYGFLVLIIFFADILLFQRELISNIFWDQNYKEQRFSVTDGELFQFKLNNGKLIAQSNDPNITFGNVNVRIGRISFVCKNSIPGAVGQVFYRKTNEPFSESHSIIYETNSNLNNKILDFPAVQAVESLRFDLTNLENDRVVCREFVINPHSPINFNLKGLVLRLTIYVCFLFFAVLMDAECNPTKTFLSGSDDF
ncbi:MAG: hypothetical protein NTW32_22975 [Chloroflexi bacterium]|nr:hypothetical protein [Chloroflexota bacterium]